MNKGLTTSGLDPIGEHETRKNVSVTTNQVQPRRAEDVPREKCKPAADVITTHNLEEVQAENAKAGKKGGKGK